MKAILNQDIIDLENFKITYSNRGFRYGDGLFETIACINGKPRLLEAHLQRMKRGVKALKIDSSDYLLYTNITRQIEQLIDVNEISGSAIIRIHLWRDSNGLYSPNANTGSYLLTIHEANFEKRKVANNVGFAEDTFNYSSKWSAIKSMSAINYVMAGIEKKERQLDEIIILDHRGFVSEGLSSNAFWKKDNTYYTSSLSTGCIEGVMRKWFIASLKGTGHKVIEIEATKIDLLRASCVFTTNALGITHIQSIENSVFNIDENAQELIETIS
jgi:branched-subunit amino acid aminotransferase/4-amino-4-deoxychorismate lyase